jgi:hypothetical protein
MVAISNSGSGLILFTSYIHYYSWVLHTIPIFSLFLDRASLIDLAINDSTFALGMKWNVRNFFVPTYNLSEIRMVVMNPSSCFRPGSFSYFRIGSSSPLNQEVLPPSSCVICRRAGSVYRLTKPCCQAQAIAPARRLTPSLL